MSNLIDLTGQIFGKWTVIRRAGSRGTARRTTALWLCRCQCGTERVVLGSGLRSGTSKSCGGCRPPKYGISCFSAEYRAHRAMINRCYLPSVAQYPNYGGRGIKVCERWRESFANFLADMGKKPSAEHSLDRINVEGNYEPKNCRWANRWEQSRNRRKFVAINNISTEHLIQELRRRGLSIVMHVRR